MNQAKMTIQQIIDTVLHEIPGEPIENTVDTVKCGDPTQEATGIVVTFTVTFEVMRRAVEFGANFIITHEPTFYNHHDRTERWEGKAVYEAKLRYLREHGLTVWRFHDHCHHPKPDGIIAGMARDWGWTAYLDPKRAAIAAIPPVPLQDLVSDLKNKLGAAHIRYVGEPTMTCRNIGMILGSAGSATQLAFLTRDDVDTVICGETSEWDVCEYVRDANSVGQSKALIVLGHAFSEEGGMRDLAEKIGHRFPGIPVQYVSAGDPFRFE